MQSKQALAREKRVAKLSPREKAEEASQNFEIDHSVDKRSFLFFETTQL